MAAPAECKVEERLMEIEALKAIYEHEFHLLGVQSAQLLTFQVKLEHSDAVLTFSLPDNYPDGLPVIAASIKGIAMTTLGSHLQHLAEDLRGEVMIHSLVEEAKIWIRTSKPSDVEEPQREELMCSPRAEEEEAVCRFFLEGKCRFGSKCFNRHEVPQGCNSAVNDDSLHSKLASHNKQVFTEKPAKVIHQEGMEEFSMIELNMLNTDEDSCSKKKSMKTASDVISRIQWDENLSKEDFVVGYLDRFVGIVEKCFGDFSWEDIASVDYNTLSIPRHRIQYFKYCGKVVWDKRDRLDRVFGSTGSGETILDVIRALGEEEKPNREMGEALNGQLNDQEQTVVNADGVRGNVLTCGLTSNTTGPNYFVALQITDPGLHEEVEKMQQSICDMEPGLANDIIPSARLHVTFLMLTLNNEDDITSAKHVLRAVQPIMTSLLPATYTLNFRGLRTFRDCILYVPIELDPKLVTLVDVLKYKFHQARICLEGNHDIFVPHMSVVRVRSSKVSPARVREIFTVLETSHSDFYFGRNNLCSLALCSKFAPKNPNGSHYKVVTVENSLLALSSTLHKKLLGHLKILYEEGTCTEMQREEVGSLLASTDACDLECALTTLTEFSQERISSLSSDHDRVLVILRGIPGSGKTYLAENSLEAKERGRVRVCGSQQLFQKTDNAACVDPSEMNIAEAYCRTRFFEALEVSVPLVVIDGVHSQLWEYLVYKRVARAFGYTCRVLEIRCTDPEDIRACQQYCTSRRSLESLVDLVQSWQDDPEAVAIQPWFRKSKFQRGSERSLKELVGEGREIWA